MTRFLTASVLVGSMLTGASAGVELAPGSGHSIHLAELDGVVYYTVDPDGYRVVATLASGADALPVRVISTLAPGQNMLISVPRSVGEPSIDVEIAHNGHALVVTDPAPAAAGAHVGEVSTGGAQPN